MRCQTQFKPCQHSENVDREGFVPAKKINVDHVWRLESTESRLPFKLLKCTLSMN
jgi:hypothetical protein